jgi:hypothetical protein
MEDTIKINFNIIGCVYVDWIQLLCPYKHSNEPSTTIKVWEMCDYLSGY